MRQLLHWLHIVKRCLPFPAYEVLVAVDRACCYIEVVGAGKHFIIQSMGGGFVEAENADSCLC